MLEMIVLVMFIALIAALVHSFGQYTVPTLNAPTSRVPEDSTLRRHFITQLKSEIEAKKGERPTDSILRRHYDAMIASELELQLATMAK